LPRRLEPGIPDHHRRLGEAAVLVDGNALAEQLLHVVEEIFARHPDVKALLEAEIDVDEIQRLHRELADQRAVRLHLVWRDLERVGNGRTHLLIDLIPADQWLGHALLLLCVTGW
jgi:hypothetical protein